MAMDAQTAASAAPPKPKPVITDQDIVFLCPSCEGELVVDREGAGMECLCAHCGMPLVIPDHSSSASASPAQSKAPAPVPPRSVTPPPAPASAPAPVRHFDFTDQTPETLARRLEDLKHQLKENMSQDMEMRGHVNRATIELHRLQLRLKKLQERQADIEAEIVAAKSWQESHPA